MIRKRLKKETIFKLTHRKTKEERDELAKMLGLSNSAVNYNLRHNKYNGILTTETALTCIEKFLDEKREDFLETVEV
jgi:predicted transcriptional regulator